MALQEPDGGVGGGEGVARGYGGVTGGLNASDQWLAAMSAAIAHDDAASPLHRVVPGACPHGVGTPPRDD